MNNCFNNNFRSPFLHIRILKKNLQKLAHNKEDQPFLTKFKESGQGLGKEKSYSSPLMVKQDSPSTELKTDPNYFKRHESLGELCALHNILQTWSNKSLSNCPSASANTVMLIMLLFRNIQTTSSVNNTSDAITECGNMEGFYPGSSLLTFLRREKNLVNHQLLHFILLVCLHVHQASAYSYTVYIYSEERDNGSFPLLK